jgi:hypothetical protein
MVEWGSGRSTDLAARGQGHRLWLRRGLLTVHGDLDSFGYGGEPQVIRRGARCR